MSELFWFSFDKQLRSLLTINCCQDHFKLVSIGHISKLKLGTFNIAGTCSWLVNFWHWKWNKLSSSTKNMKYFVVCFLVERIEDRKSILYEHHIHMEEGKTDSTRANQLVSDLCESLTNGVDTGTAKLYTSVVHEMRRLEANTLAGVLASASCEGYQSSLEWVEIQFFSWDKFHNHLTYCLIIHSHIYIYMPCEGGVLFLNVCLRSQITHTVKQNFDAKDSNSYWCLDLIKCKD